MAAADVVFVVPGAAQTELARLRALDVDRDWRCFADGVSAWIVQTYLLLRAHGQSVALRSTFSPEAINIAHVAQLAPLRRPRGCFVVGVRADYPPVGWCRLHIVQNQTQVRKASVWVAHWPQPGLIPRDPERGSRIERVGYFGRNVNHYTRLFRRPSGWFRVKEEIQAVCDHLGLVLVCKGAETWNDYSDVDLVLGLRSFGRRTYDTKPPSKLINAWLAGVAFVAGNDSAYSQVGNVESDFLRCLTPAELEKHLQILMYNPALVLRLIRNGRESASAFERQAVTASWVNLLRELDGCSEGSRP